MLEAGMMVEIMENGEWVGPFTITSDKGRTPEHIVLEGNFGKFELYADAPFNVRPFTAPIAKDNRPLAEGVFGAKVVAYFQENMDIVPVDCLYMDQVSATELTYRMSFDDGSVADYKVTFAGPSTLDIESIDFFDQVI